jgi:hypothetical protein
VARLLIDHPHAYREWRIVGAASERGFYHLESSVRLDQFETTNSAFVSTRPNLKGYDGYSGHEPE